MKIQHIIETSGCFTFPWSGGEATRSVTAPGVHVDNYVSDPGENTACH